MLKNFRTYQLSIQFHRNCSQLKLDHDLKRQLNRASSSIVLNLAEGSGKPTWKDKRRFYSFSLGSLRECQAILDLSEASSDMYDLSDKLGAYIYKLIKNTGP